MDSARRKRVERLLEAVAANLLSALLLYGLAVAADLLPRPRVDTSVVPLLLVLLTMSALSLWTAYEAEAEGDAPVEWRRVLRRGGVPALQWAALLTGGLVVLVVVARAVLPLL